VDIYPVLSAPFLLYRLWIVRCDANREHLDTPRTVQLPRPRGRLQCASPAARDIAIRPIAALVRHGDAAISK
jgi:hypothetical protein